MNSISPDRAQTPLDRRSALGRISLGFGRRGVGDCERVGHGTDAGAPTGPGPAQTRLPEATDDRRRRAGLAAVRRDACLRRSRPEESRTGLLDRRRTVEGSRPVRGRQDHARNDVGAVPQFDAHRYRGSPGHHAGQKPRSRPRHRVLPEAHRELRGRSGSTREVQPDAARRAAYGPYSRSRRLQLQHLETRRRQEAGRRARPAPAASRPTTTGNASRTSWSASSRSRTAQGPPRLPSARSGGARRAFRESTRCSARSTD